MKTIKIKENVHEKLSHLAIQLACAKSRNVTLSETIETLLEQRERFIKQYGPNKK